MAEIKGNFYRARKSCSFCTDGVQDVDYKDIRMLGRFLGERGRLAPGRVSGVCAAHQRKLGKAIKRARYLALLPFVSQD